MPIKTKLVMNRGKMSLDSLRIAPRGTRIQVRNLTTSKRMEFVSDSQNVAGIRDYTQTDYDSYFIEVRDGDYTQIWAMSGIVPASDKNLIKVV